ncbi:MAG: hypothetical protein JXA10_17850, partial [Anaerolineae bacterium]|nr:hypothetical protein [Anaerolineae bacterium]
MIKKFMPLTIIAVMVLALIPTGYTSANSVAITLTTTLRQTEPITWYGATAFEVSSFDPQRA